MDNNVIVTRHAAKRLKERSGLNKKSIQRMANKAYEFGHTYSDLNGGIRRWILRTRYSKGCPTDVKLYGDKAYIFCQSYLVTVIQIPTEFSGWKRNLRKCS